jgi:protein involved in plasmid replication-relaxation
LSGVILVDGVSFGMAINLKKKDLLFLRSLAEYRLLTARQASIIDCIGERAVRNRVNSLSEAGLLKLWRRSLGRDRGRPESVISLSEKGVNLLKEKNIDASKIFSDQVADQEFKYIEHHLLVNWCRIHLLHLERNIPGLSGSFYSPTTPFLPRRKDGKPAISDMVRVEGRDEWIIPDGVFLLKSIAREKRLLFFLEVDMSTETLASPSGNKGDLTEKIIKYLEYIKKGGYKRYEKACAGCQLNGFRLLIITNSSIRKQSICRLINDFPPLNYLWVTDQVQMFECGIGARIWARGGRADIPSQSILGPTLTVEIPLLASEG